MLESMSPVSLDELEQVLKSLNERLKYLEKVVVPSRVTKEELHAGVSEANFYTMTRCGSMSHEIRLLKQQMATKSDLEQLREALSNQIAALRQDARSSKGAVRREASRARYRVALFKDHRAGFPGHVYCPSEDDGRIRLPAESSII